MNFHSNLKANDEFQFIGDGRLKMKHWKVNAENDAASHILFSEYCKCLLPDDEGNSQNSRKPKKFPSRELLIMAIRI